MGILSGIKSLIGKRATKFVGNEYITLASAASASGETVTAETAMRITAVYSCCRLIGETFASLPCILYREKGENRDRAKDHPLYQILHDMPNPYQTSMEFYETLMWHVLLRGNGYAEIMLNGAGVVTALYIRHPDSVTPFVTKEGSLRYRIVDGGVEYTKSHDLILHVRGPSWNGISGLSVLDLAREQFGNAIAMDKHTGNAFKNGARMGGILVYPGKLSPQAVENLKSSWKKQTSGAENSGETAVLEHGLEYKPISMTNEQAQFLDEKKLTRSQIAAIFRAPPHMIGDLERATFSNIEQQSLEFYQYTIRPWLVRVERAMKSKLFSDRERLLYKAEFNADALLRGDFLTRQQGLAIQRSNGVINIDEWRALENRNPLPDNKGKQHLVPMNMQEAGTEPEPQTTVGGVPNAPGTVNNEPDNQPRSNMPPTVIREVVIAELRRIVDKEEKALSSGKRNKDEFLSEFEAQVCARVAPLYSAALQLANGLSAEQAKETARQAASRYSKGYVNRSKEDKLCPGRAEEARLPDEEKAFFGELQYEGH